MRYTPTTTPDGQISEMAIVDTFTRLIFGDYSEIDPREEVIIQALRNADENVLMDSHEQMGQYLRTLGVREMIHLVSRVQEEVVAESDAAVREIAASTGGKAAKASANKRPH